MGERWINGGSFLCKNPDTTDLRARRSTYACTLYYGTTAISGDDANPDEDWALVEYDGSAKPALGGACGYQRTDLIPEGYVNEGDEFAPLPPGGP